MLMRQRISFLLLSMLLAVLAGCGRQTQQRQVPPPSVTVARPVQREIGEYRDYTGSIEATEKVEIRARVTGYLKKIHFREGTEVNEGDLLYEIDPRTFQASLESSQAEVSRLEAQLNLTTSEAELASRVIGRGGVTKEEYLQKVAAREEARAALAKARAAVKSAELELSFTRIHAPIAGRVGRTLVTEGNLVGQNEATLLTTLVKMDPIYVYFEAPERDFLIYQRLRREETGLPTAEEKTAPVNVGLETEEGHPHKGVVDFRDNRVDEGTGTILLRGVLPNPDRLLIPGLFARVRVPFGKPQKRLLVPQSALQADQKGRYLLVVNSQDTAEYRPIKTGITQESLIVVEEGLKPDDRVIVNGIQRARPGEKVTVEEGEEKQVEEPDPAGM